MKNLKIKTELGVPFNEEWSLFDRSDAEDVEKMPVYAPFTLGGDCDQYLHFAGLEVFNRYEDAKEGQYVSVFGKEIDISSDMSGNPSYRRDAVVLYFHSELGPHVKMKLAQHKGETRVSFETWDGIKPEVK